MKTRKLFLLRGAGNFLSKVKWKKQASESGVVKTNPPHCDLIPERYFSQTYYNWFSLDRPTGPIQSLSRNVRLSVVCAPFCLLFFKCLITSIYKGQKSNQPITKRLLMEKLRKNIGLRFNNFCPEIVKNHCTKNCFVLVFTTHCLWI